MLNKVMLIGNVGQDPEVRYSQNNNNKIISFSLATSESYKDKATGERKTQTQWHRVVIFNQNLCDIAEKYIKKGSKVYVEGAIQNRKYTGTDGVERSVTEVVISQFRGEIKLLDSRGSIGEDQDMPTPERSSSSKSNNEPQEESNFSRVGDDLDDEIPF